MASRSHKRRFGSGGAQQLYLIGTLTAGVYLLACFFYRKGPQVYTRVARELFAWFCVISLLFLFWKGYRVVVRSAVSVMRPVLIFAALFCLISILIFPFHSTDVFGYINRGWQQVHYQQNPYLHPLGDVPQWQQDPMLREHWIYNPNPYGFLFTLLARFLCQLGGGNWWLTLLLFKNVNALAYWVTAWLVWDGARLLGHEKPGVAVYAFLWNPLVLMQHLANGHNDVLVGCLIAASLYLAIRGAVVWIVPVLVAATLVKYGPAVLIPLALIYIVRRKGWKAAALGCLLGLLLLVLISAPYVSDWNLFRLAEIRDNATLIDNSLHSLLIHLYENISRLFPGLTPFHAAADALIRHTLRFGFLLFLLVQVLRLPRNFPTKLLIEKSSLLMFALICVASSKFNAWYLGMLLPSALLLEERHWLRRLTLLITGTELLALTFFKQAYMLNYFAMILIPAGVVFRRIRRESSDIERGVELPVARTLASSPRP